MRMLAAAAILVCMGQAAAAEDIEIIDPALRVDPFGVIYVAHAGELYGIRAAPHANVDEIIDRGAGNPLVCTSTCGAHLAYVCYIRDHVGELLTLNDMLVSSSLAVPDPMAGHNCE